MKNSIFWDIKQRRPLKSLVLLVACFMMFSCFAYSWTLKREVTCFSETSVDFQPTTRYYVPEKLFTVAAVRISNPMQPFGYHPNSIYMEKYHL
jgi:hypothetical protein